MSADVSKPADATALVDFNGRIGGPDPLVNNAGVQVEKTIGESTDADWDLVVDINCRGVFNMSRAVLPVMRNTAGPS